MALCPFQMRVWKSKDLGKLLEQVLPRDTGDTGEGNKRKVDNWILRLLAWASFPHPCIEITCLHLLIAPLLRLPLLRSICRLPLLPSLACAFPLSLPLSCLFHLQRPSESERKGASGRAVKRCSDKTSDLFKSISSGAQKNIFGPSSKKAVMGSVRRLLQKFPESETILTQSTCVSGREDEQTWNVLVSQSREVSLAIITCYYSNNKKWPFSNSFDFSWTENHFGNKTSWFIRVFFFFKGPTGSYKTVIMAASKFNNSFQIPVFAAFLFLSDSVKVPTLWHFPSMLTQNFQHHSPYKDSDMRDKGCS